MIGGDEEIEKREDGAEKSTTLSDADRAQSERSEMQGGIQSGVSYLSQGFEGNVLGSSPGRLADTVATYPHN